MEQSKKRALEDIERRIVTYSSKRRRQDRASNADSLVQVTTTSNPSIATSSPTLIGSPAPVTLSRNFHPATPSYSSSTTSSSASTSESSESDASSSSNDETDSVDYASTSSADSRIRQSRSHPPSHLPRMISPSTTSSGTSTNSESYTSASSSEDITESLSSSSDASSSSDDESVSSSESESSSSADSTLSSLTSAHASQLPTLSVASLTADNLSHLQSRLNALLPKLKNANEVLDTERQEGRLERWNIENVGEESEERGYIEMDLGLGVLEEKAKSSGGEPQDEKHETEGEKDGGAGEWEGDVLGNMMGKRRGKTQERKVGIEEVRS